MQPTDDSKTNYKFTFLWKTTANREDVEHLKTGILKFDYKNFIEQGEATIVSFFPRIHQNDPLTIPLKQFKGGKSPEFSLPWLDLAGVTYAYRLEWDDKQLPPQTGEVNDLIKKPSSTPILKVPLELYPGNPVYPVNKQKNAQFWPSDKANPDYVKANLQIHQNIPRADKPTTVSLRIDFIFWRQVTLKYEKWDAGLKKRVRKARHNQASRHNSKPSGKQDQNRPKTKSQKIEMRVKTTALNSTNKTRP